jgi:hypothetical protein
MGLVNSAGFPAAGEVKEDKKPKKTKVVEKSEPIEECCALGCDDCGFADVETA